MWTDEDRGYALAWMEEKALTHDACGQPFAESMARENQWAYDAQIVRCHACAAKDRIAAQYTSQEGADQAGLLVQLTRTPAGRTS